MTTFYTYNLKHHGRAVLIGEKTRGAGHRGTYRPVGTQFQAFIPRSRPVHPVTGTGFEGVGVIPNYEVPVDEALDVAYRMALQRLASTTEDPEQKSRIEALLNKQGAQQILDEFVLEQYPSGRVKFVRDDAGAIVEVQVLTLQGQWETSKRDGP